MKSILVGRLFLENGVAGLFQASDFESVNQMSLFRGMFVNTTGRTVEKPEITIFFSPHCELIRFINRYDLKNELCSPCYKLSDQKLLSSR